MLRVEQEDDESEMTTDDDILEDDNSLERCEFVNLAEDPMTFEEAINSEDAEKWIKALENEILAQIKNKTWKIVEKPNDRKIIGN